MMNYSVDMKQVQTKLKWLSNKRNLQPHIIFALSKVALKMRSDVIPKTPRALGGLINSWRVEKGFDNDLEVGYDIIYASYQERGKRHDGTRVIKNRPAGGETGFMSNTIDDNLKGYFDLFEKELFKRIFNTKSKPTTNEFFA